MKIKTFFSHFIFQFIKKEEKRKKKNKRQFRYADPVLLKVETRLLFR